MKQIFKWLFRLVLSVVLLIVVAIIVLPMAFDPNDHKARIADLVEDSIGRQIELSGEIKWSVFPWLGLTFNEVKILNDKGFNSEYLAEIKQLSAKVKFLPLFSKDIQLNTITLNEPVITLQINKTGKSNWQSILNHLDQQASGDEADSSLQIRGIDINQGQVKYSDLQSDLLLQIEDLNMSTDQISQSQTTLVELQMQLNLPDSGLTTKIDAHIQLQNLLSEQGVQIRFDQLFMVGNMSADSTLPLSLELSGDSLIDLDKDSLSFEQINVQLGPLQLSTTLTASNLSGLAKFTGALMLDEFELDELLKQLGSPLNNQADNLFSGSAQWLYRNNQLKLNKLKMKLDQSNLTGEVDIRQLDKMQGGFSLNVDQIDLDKYLPVIDDSDSVDADSSMQALDFGYLEGSISVETLNFQGLKLNNIMTNIKTSGQNLSVSPLKADFYQGSLNTQLSLNSKKTSSSLQLSHKMSKIQTGSLLVDLIGSEYLTGVGQLLANITVDKPFSDKPLKTAGGKVSFRLSDGAIYGVDVFGIMQKGLSILSKAKPDENKDEIKTTFALMELDADIKQGILTTSKLSISSPYFTLSGNVRIDLDAQTIKGSITPMLTNIPDDLVGEGYKILLNLPVPVSLTGSLLEPKIKIDIKDLILASQKDKIDQKKQELKKDLLNKLFGDDEPAETDSEHSVEEKPPSEKDQLKNMLLDNLFKDKKDNLKDKDGG